MNQASKQIISRFQALRDKFGLSQRAFSEILGLSQATISRMENGEIGLPLALVILACVYLENLGDVQSLRSKHAMNAKTLKQARKAMGLSKWALSKYLNVSVTTITRWESSIDVTSSIFITIAIEQLRIELTQRKDLSEMTIEQSAQSLFEDLLAA